jgi:nitronate monooxygenase
VTEATPEPNDAIATPFTAHAHVSVPLICGAMYPCSNPELVAAVSDAGAIGIVQPISLTYVHGHEFRAGLKYIRRLTSRPIGFNALIERSSRRYHDRMMQWVEIALEEGVRFFVTSLGNPRWVVDRVEQAGGVVYHDVTERKWAQKGLDAGARGLIAVNNRAGGHAGPLSAEQLIDDLGDLGLPLVCAGGIGSAADFVSALRMGYAAAQIGTRFIATRECNAHTRYKQAILDAGEDDIVLTERLTGIPVSVIATPYIRRIGTRSGAIARHLLRGRRTKHLMRTAYALRSLWQLKRGLHRGDDTADYWQAGKSVASIDHEMAAGDVVREFAAAATTALSHPTQRGAPAVR